MLKKLIYSNRVFNFLLILIAISSFTILYLSRNNNNNSSSESKNVVSLFNKDSVIHEDLNGDNKKDTIVVKDSENGLIAQVNLNKDETFSLNYNKDFQTLGEYCPYWPTRISTIDITRDNSKEIIIQSSFHNKAVQHIFSWNGSGYSDIFCSDNNLIGFVDSCNSKSPKLFSGNFSNGNIDLKGYIYNNGSMDEFNNSITGHFPGIDTLSNFICLMESFPDQSLSVPNYFYSQISGNDLETIFRLANGSNHFKFQDGYFADLAWDEKGNITCENWILNFRAIDVNNNEKVGNLTINVMINKYEDTDFPYKITSVNAY